MDMKPGTPDRHGLVDSFGRRVTYLRISVTDRCDFRCTYCMSEHMQFLPKKDVLSFEEIETIADRFISRGVSKIRLTGGEPLVRKDIMSLVERLGSRIGASGLQELTLTTNGSQLARLAPALAAAGIRRVNVSLDTQRPERFREITRRGNIHDVLEGISAAMASGLAVKINMVALRDINDDEIEPMLHWAHSIGCSLTLIEAMPLGEVQMDRVGQHLPLSEVHARLQKSLTLRPLQKKTGGPARYFSVAETGGELGYITPFSHNFCESCNRVRLTCTGQLYMCLGQDSMVDLRAALRQDGGEGLDRALDLAMLLKPRGHDFDLGRNGDQPAVKRHMSVTGG